ncbi:GAF and ANTAR domain-containing protein [Kineococcus sp. NBC_00420]|uniref:GAF and ANTAR domain-containing protein n=1 Tax=Kineococcus sp. NBC_00420 TaxID=2903564 RepID=UPI002E1BA763
MSAASSREVLGQAAQVMARARRTDERLRWANRQLAGRLGGRPSPGDDPRPPRLSETSPELALCLETARVVPFDRAAVSLVSAGVPVAPLAGSDPGLVLFVDQQHSVQEGPEVEALRTGRPVLVADLASQHGRWPYLAGLGRWASFRSLAALPVASPGTGTVGVLTVARDLPRAFDRQDEFVLTRLADLLLALLLTRTAPPTASGSSAAGETVPYLRPDTVSTALGVLRQRHGVQVDEIVSRLQAVAFVTGRTVHELAEAVVQGRWDPLLDDAGGV